MAMVDGNVVVTVEMDDVLTTKINECTELLVSFDAIFNQQAERITQLESQVKLLEEFVAMFTAKREPKAREPEPWKIVSYPPDKPTNQEEIDNG